MLPVLCLAARNSGVSALARAVFAGEQFRPPANDCLELRSRLHRQQYAHAKPRVAQCGGCSSSSRIWRRRERRGSRARVCVLGPERQRGLEERPGCHAVHSSGSAKGQVWW